MRGFSMALTLLLAPTALFADCEEVQTLTLAPHAQTGEGNGARCEWRTERWAPVEGCGVFGFEVEGPGAPPRDVAFKRSTTMYETVWESRQTNVGWSAGMLAEELTRHRCFAGWCDPLSYVLRTSAPVRADLCAEDLTLLVRLEARSE